MMMDMMLAVASPPPPVLLFTKSTIHISESSNKWCREKCVPPVANYWYLFNIICGDGM